MRSQPALFVAVFPGFIDVKSMLQLTFTLLCFTHIAACVLHFIGLPVWDDSDCADTGMCGWVERQGWVTAKDCADGAVDHDGVVADAFDSLGLDFQTEAAAGSCLETPRLVRYGASFYCKKTREFHVFPSPPPPPTHSNFVILLGRSVLNPRSFSDALSILTTVGFGDISAHRIGERAATT